MSTWCVRQMSVREVAERAVRQPVFSGTPGVCKVCLRRLSAGQLTPYKMRGRYHFFRLCATCDSLVQKASDASRGQPDTTDGV